MYPEGQDILVVSDDPAERDYVAELLGTEGFAVTEAAEGLAAVRAAGAKRFSLIVAAVRLPGSLDGPATVRQVRARQPWLKALFTERELRMQRGNPDTDDVIAAPFERREFLGCVFELLQRDADRRAADLASRVRTACQAS